MEHPTIVGPKLVQGEKCCRLRGNDSCQLRPEKGRREIWRQAEPDAVSTWNIWGGGGGVRGRLHGTQAWKAVDSVTPWKAEVERLWVVIAVHMCVFLPLSSFLWFSTLTTVTQKNPPPHHL